MDQNQIQNQDPDDASESPETVDDLPESDFEDENAGDAKVHGAKFSNLPDLPIRQNLAGAAGTRKFVAYTVKLPAEQLAALQSIWLELKRLYGAHSPDKSGMIQHAITDWLKRWDGPERQALLEDLLEIRQDTRRRQYKK